MPIRILGKKECADGAAARCLSDLDSRKLAVAVRTEQGTVAMPGGEDRWGGGRRGIPGGRARLTQLGGMGSPEVSIPWVAVAVAHLACIWGFLFTYSPFVFARRR